MKKTMYQFTSKYITKDENVIWDKIKTSFKPLEIIYGLKGIEYKILTITNSSISFKAKSRNEGIKETIFKEDLLPILYKLKTQRSFNTESVKEIFKGPLNKISSPIFAILMASEIIQEVGVKE